MAWNNRLTVYLVLLRVLGMLLITTALMLEARPLVERLGMKALGGSFPVYENADMRLVVTGVGPLRASAATGWALGRFPDIHAAVNIGFCGALPSVAPLHQWRLILSVRDQPSGRLYIPDILFQHAFEEAELLSVPKVVRKPLDWRGVVDMEGSAFFEAGRQMLALHRMVILKWVSDPLTGTIDPEHTQARFAESIEELLPFLRDWYAWTQQDPAHEDPQLLALCEARLRLTATQRAFLRKWLLGYECRGGSREIVEGCLPDQLPKTRKENAVIFNQLRHALKG
jgi:hypothetical protein